MSLYRPFFHCTPEPDSVGMHTIIYNVDGSLNFHAQELVNAKVARLINMAIEEGKRRRSMELMVLLKGGE